MILGLCTDLLAFALQLRKDEYCNILINKIFYVRLIFSKITHCQHLYNQKCSSFW